MLEEYWILGRVVILICFIDIKYLREENIVMDFIDIIEVN